MTRFPLHSFYSMGFHNRIDQTVPRMVAEFSSTLGMIFPLVFFQVQIKLKVFFTEINFTENKWLICKSYNLLKSNISNHLHHLGKGLDNYYGIYDIIILLRDFNSEFPDPRLNGFCDIYNLKNLLKKPTYYRNPDIIFPVFLHRHSRFLQTDGQSLKNLL